MGGNMRLRNKKTGEVETCEAITIQTDIRVEDYLSLAELNDEWEDYKPAEPLIKDEEIRKAVRAWAEVNAIRQVSYVTDSRSCRLADLMDNDYCIDFVGWIPTLNDMKRYTIAEL